MTTPTTTAAPAPVIRSTSHLAAFARGFGWGVRGLVSKEVRSRGRGWRPVAMLTAYLLALTLGVAGFLVLAERSNLILSPWLGLQLFSALALGAVMLLAFITPSLTAGAISGERERRTLDLMLVTRSSTLGLVAGKLAGSLLYVLFLLLASLPAFALVYLFGGIPVPYLLVALAVLGATAVAHASLGLMLSALMRRTIVASVTGYFIVLALVFGLPFVAAVTSTSMTGGPDVFMARGMPGMISYSEPYPMAPVGGPPPAFSYASPLVAISSALPSGYIETGTQFLNEVIRLVSGGSNPVNPPGQSLLRPVYASGADPMTGQMEAIEIWAPWLFYVGGALAMAPLAVAVSAIALSPRKPWQHRFRHRSAAPLTTPAVTTPALTTTQDVEA